MPTTSAMELRHLQREVATALELALVAMAPTTIIESLAGSAGLLTALIELPLETDSLRLWAADAAERAQKALSAWHEWEETRRATA